MLNKEEMTGKERIKAAINFQKKDRVPVFPLYHWGTAGLFNISVEDFSKDYQIQSKCLIDACKMFDYDGINVGVDVIVEAEAFGGVSKFPTDSPPYFSKFPLQDDKNKLKGLKVKNPETSGRMAIEIETSVKVVEKMGKEKYTMGWIMGPLNCASQLRGVKDTMVDIVLDPDYFEELLDFALEQVLAYGKSLAKTGLDCIGIGEALASPNFNSPKVMYKYVFPRYKRLIEELHEEGADTILHICGNIYPLLNLGKEEGKNIFKETGTDILDIDWQVDMKDAIDITGICCRGNLDPPILINGTKEQVLEEARKIILRAGPTKGLIFGSGCDMSYYTPKENVKAMVEAVKKYGN